MRSAELERIAERRVRQAYPPPVREPPPGSHPDAWEHYRLAVQRREDLIAGDSWLAEHPYVPPPRPRAYSADADPRRLMRPVPPEPRRPLVPTDPRQLCLFQSTEVTRAAS